MAEKKKLLKRSEVPLEYRWKIEDVYPNDEAWEEDFKQCKEMGQAIGTFRYTLNASPAQLRFFFEQQDKLGMLLDRVYLYAAMKKDEDNGNPHYAGMKDRVQNLAVSIEAALSWVEPEILDIPVDTLNEWLKTSDLEPYRRAIELITRQRPYILSPAEERIIAQAGDFASGPKDIFTMLNNADITFPMIEDEDGEAVQLTHGNYILFMESDNREVRKRAFQALYETYGKQKKYVGSFNVRQREKR